ncbi:condensin complex protein MksE [Psychrosphaera haliotis]|uniref:DUF4194 domain-containing protein n=1 Tax=Psychrosphaera haliotis TaxID=555083 RepID=A0A6N8F599_9GAMM|nr:hypothetical protein [Psychrosphaera haliotis]MUH71826.1 hypothetical protein [Psychrosphaera haliotis]
MISQKGIVLEKLLSGHFICETTDEDSYRFLKTSAGRMEVEAHLAVLNRQLTHAAEEQVFFASYQTIGETERVKLGKQFEDVSNHLLPLIEWLLLVQESLNNDLSLSQGMNLRLNELQTIIEDTPAYAEQLNKISRYALFGSKAAELDAQLKLVFKRLVELGYLIKPNQDKQIYTVTGKIDYLFDVLKFIDETEQLSLAKKAEDAMSQSDLI